MTIPTTNLSINNFDLSLAENLLLRFITGQLPLEDKYKNDQFAPLTHVAEAALREIVNDSYGGDYKTAYRAWNVHADASAFEKISSAFRSVYPNQVIPAQLEGTSLSSIYRAESYKHSRLVLWEALSGNHTLRNIFQSASGIQVEEAFNEWLSDNATRVSSIESLNLSGQNLRRIPPEIGQLSQLRALDLDHNQIRTIPPEIGRLSQLIELNLHNNKIQTIPPEIVELPQLGCLTLNNNQIEIIPPEIEKFSQLGRLNLENNQIRTLPPEIGRLSRLRILYLAHNQIQTIPPEIGTLSQLSILDLENNQIKSLPPAITQLSALKSLYLSHNQMQTIPPEIDQLRPQLCTLELDHNPLSSMYDLAKITFFAVLDSFIGHSKK